MGQVAASVDAGDAVLRRPNFTRTAVERRLFGPGGAITPRTLRRAVVPGVRYVVILGEQAWVTPIAPGDEPEARRFVGWVNASAAHYRYG